MTHQSGEAAALTTLAALRGPNLGVELATLLMEQRAADLTRHPHVHEVTVKALLRVLPRQGHVNVVDLDAWQRAAKRVDMRVWSSQTELSEDDGLDQWTTGGTWREEDSSDLPNVLDEYNTVEEVVNIFFLGQSEARVWVMPDLIVAATVNDATGTFEAWMLFAA